MRHGRWRPHRGQAVCIAASGHAHAGLEKTCGDEVFSGQDAGTDRADAWHEPGAGEPA